MKATTQFWDRDFLQDDVLLVPASEIECRRIEWLWPDWLAAGKVHVLAGAPGVGKTTLSMDIAARVSAGNCFPDGAPCRPGNVLIWSGEDDPSDSLKPRLQVAGANMDRVRFVSEVMSAGETRLFDPARDFRKLMRKVQEIGEVALVILDPVVCAVSGDSHKNGEVRRDLQCIVEFAFQTGAAVLGITHFSKGTVGRDPLERVTGSVAFSALPRVVMVAARSQAHNGHRILARAKSNLGPDDGAFLYSLVEGSCDDFPAPAIRWEDEIDGSANDLFGQGEGRQSSGQQLQQACEWLETTLQGGPGSASEICQAAMQAGFSKRTLERAKDKLQVRSSKDGFGGSWVWQLPSEERQRSPSPTDDDAGDLGGLGGLH